MKRRTSITVLVTQVLVLAWLLSVPACASAQQKVRPEEQLNEVVVTGTRIKPSRNMQTIIEWLRRLPGEFRYDGYVELQAGPGMPTSRLPVQGLSDCVAFGAAPGVQCAVDIRWPKVSGENGTEVPGGSSVLDPAMILYGLDPDHRAIHFLQVDKRGVAEGGLGYLEGNTLVTTAPCEGIPGNCQRTTRIDAQPDGKLIQMQVDINQDDAKPVRYSFVMHRLSQAEVDAIDGSPRK